MTFFGLIAGILCFSCWYIQSESVEIDCRDVSAMKRNESYFFYHVYNNKYWTVRKTGNTEYEFHPLGVNIDTLVKFSTGYYLNLLKRSLPFEVRSINNYYNDLNSSKNELTINNEIYPFLRVDDTKIIFITDYEYSKLRPQYYSPEKNMSRYSRYKTAIYSNYEFALIDQKDNYNVLIFQSCSIDESDTWTLISEKKLRNAIAPDGSLNAEIEGIHVDHMPELLFQPKGLDEE